MISYIRRSLLVWQEYEWARFLSGTIFCDENKKTLKDPDRR
jgi:hypothetical protein